jgi:hypothetical protein
MRTPLPWGRCGNPSSRVIPRSPALRDDEESRTPLKILKARFLAALKMPVIPSEARNLALVRKQCKIPRFARNDKVFSWFLGARQPTGMSDCHENACAVGALECGSLLPLFAGRLAGRGTEVVRKWREQARSRKAAASCRTPKRFAHFHAQWRAEGSWHLRSE